MVRSKQPRKQESSTKVAYLFLIQQPQVQFLAVRRLFLLLLLRFIDVTAKNSGQSLENISRTHLVLASGILQLILHKD